MRTKKFHVSNLNSTLYKKFGFLKTILRGLSNSLPFTELQIYYKILCLAPY